MIGREKLFARLEKFLAASAADQTEIVYIGNEYGLTRYANSYIHQNVSEKDCKIFFRTVFGKKVGVASTNSLVAADLKKALDDSIEIARNQPENPAFPGLPKPAGYVEMNTFDDTTAGYTPAARARGVRRIIAEAKRKKFTVAGSFSTGEAEIAVLNSNGVRAWQPGSNAGLNIIAMSENSSGYAAGTSRKVEEIDIDMLAKRAVDKCALSVNPQSIEPGDYEVILEPPAVSEMLEWINYVSLGSKSFEQGTSFLAGRIGKKLTSEKITLYDDALDQSSMSFPFDFEGVPKKKVVFLNKGVAKGVVYDSASAKKAGKKSTGHALTPDGAAEGALSLNLFLKPGTVPREKMISKMKRGILVTRFHYINGLIDTRNAVLTGMTRDGTFLVEDGEIKCGLKNLRFTDSVTRSFGTAIALSKEVEKCESWWSAIGCMTVPAIHLGSFRFSGKTEF